MKFNVIVLTIDVVVIFVYQKIIKLNVEIVKKFIIFIDIIVYNETSII